jgi:predicted ATPase
MITNLLLRNFKCFETQSFDIRNLTLLAGLNGMGKSSVLQALLLLRQSYLDGLLPGTGLELNGSLVRLGTAQDVLYEDAQDDEFEIGLLWDDGANAEFIIQYFREADVLGIAGSLDRSIFMRAPFTDGFHYLQAERLGPRLTNAISDYQVLDHRQVGATGEYSQHFLHVYGTGSVSDKRLLHADS